jgi:formate dehydrogenase subunit delta
MTRTTAPADGAPQAGHPDMAAKLRHMAGQIADFFKPYPEAEAVAAIADHINQFWTGRMRATFLTAFAGRPEELPPLLRGALPLIRPARAG